MTIDCETDHDFAMNDGEADSRLWNMGHRNYADGVLGRFISRDPIGHAGDLNLYSYTANPVNVVDPSGLGPVELVVGGAVAIGALLYLLLSRTLKACAVFFVLPKTIRSMVVTVTVDECLFGFHLSGGAGRHWAVFTPGGPQGGTMIAR